MLLCLTLPEGMYSLFQFHLSSKYPAGKNKKNRFSKSKSSSWLNISSWPFWDVSHHCEQSLTFPIRKLLNIPWNIVCNCWCPMKYCQILWNMLNNPIIDHRVSHSYPMKPKFVHGWISIFHGSIQLLLRRRRRRSGCLDVLKGYVWEICWWLG